MPTDRIGSASIADLASDTTLKQGLYGAVVVAPASKAAGQQTTFTVTVADDDVKLGQDFMPYPPGAEPGRSLINYQAAPAGDGPSSFTNPGRVPWMTAYAGDPTTVHVLMARGSENSHVFSLGGLRWSQDQFMDSSMSMTAQGMGP